MDQRTSRFLPLVAAVLALAGCSGDDSDADSSVAAPDMTTDGTGGVSAGAPARPGVAAPAPGGPDSADGDDASAGADQGVVPESGDTPVEPVDPAVTADATTFFFSYDESASTAARDLTLFALDEGLRPAPRLGRPYEFLNAERFAPFDPRPLGDFTASMTLRRAMTGDVPLPTEIDGTLYALGVNLQAPPLPLAERPNLVLTVLIDVSGSMDSPYASETRTDVRSLLDVVRHGLSRIGPSLKAGDVLSLVTFSTTADVILEGAGPTTGEFEAAVATLSTEGSTNIRLGVDTAYAVANRLYDPDKANRVLILTDAMVNTGELDPARIAEATVVGGREGILFSGVGIGSGFDDRVLDGITEAGRGTYSAMITPSDAERLFGEGFSRFVSPAATDVRFRLTYPQALDQLRSFGEEISTVAEEVRTVNFSHGAGQFFLELFTGPDALDADSVLELGATYTDPAGERREVVQARSVGELLANGTGELDAALAVTTLAELVAGRLECAAVRTSGLYFRPTTNATYESYRGYVDRFCDQEPPYRYVDY